MKKIKLLGILFISLLILGSCTEGWEDMNTDPNSTDDAPAENILINVQRGIANTLGDVWWTGNNTSSYAGHIAKIQYIDENRYQERDVIIERWGTLMGYQVDLNKIVAKAQASENAAMEGVALTIKAMLWQIMTDTYGAIPFTEGAKGEDGVLQPAYDSQQTVYTALLAMLEEANTLLAEGGTIRNDIWNANSVALWRKFANSLHLRVAIRMSKVNAATAKTELQKILVTSPGTYPVLSSNADEVTLNWFGTSPYWEPFYGDQRSRDDHGMCKTFIDALLATSDPRIGEFAYPAASDGVYRGVPAGMTNAQQQQNPLNTISRIGLRYRKSPTGATYFMRYAEVKFIEAEAYERADLLNNAASAEAAYTAGIVASCTEHGVASGAINTYLTNANVAWGTVGSWGYTNLQKIHYQKWVSLFKQGHEAWAETRRTDIPLMSPAPGAVPASILTNHNRPPFRWPYPTSEYTLNKAVVEANDDAIVDRFWGAKMWWDTRTGVN
ncbi:MAG: SusD/RagB family nutrient-binding outer membrane lipoprotein [Bacteroidales bacterium]|jgi:hypothetical protein|nr:SusD/RagB family nutrient-binding outer membrane lipoprotein [Bacteroidales bacterium]